MATPGHLTIAIPFVTAECASVDGLGPSDVLVSEGALAAEEPIAKLTHVLVAVGEACAPMPVEFSSEEVTTLVGIVLIDILELVYELAVMRFVVLEVAIELTACAKAQLPSANTSIIDPAALIDISVGIVMLALTISLHLGIHSSFVYLSILILYLCWPGLEHSSIEGGLNDYRLISRRDAEDTFTLDLVIRELALEVATILVQDSACPMALVLHKGALEDVAVGVDNSSNTMLKPVNHGAIVVLDSFLPRL